jgi:broad specificity phosphatase PhoE
MVVLLRHGQTLGNVDKRNYIDLDDDGMCLTDQGQHQVRDIAAALHRLPLAPSELVSSPERRCQETARLLQVESEVIVEASIRAQNWGHLRFAGARELLGTTQSWPTSLDARFPGGESAREVRARCRKMADYLQARHGKWPDQLECIITHGVIIRMLLSFWADWPDAVIEETPSVKPGTGVLAFFTGSPNEEGPIFERFASGDEFSQAWSSHGRTRSGRSGRVDNCL